MIFKLNIFKDYPQDYCAEMKDVPASPIGSTSGANIVNIGMWIRVSSRFEIEVWQSNYTIRRNLQNLYVLVSITPGPRIMRLLGLGKICTKTVFLDAQYEIQTLNWKLMYLKRFWTGTV